MLKQNWMAASEKIRGRPRLPLAGAYHGVSLSSQIVSDPRALSASLRALAPISVAFHGLPFLRGGITACAPR